MALCACGECGDDTSHTSKSSSGARGIANAEKCYKMAVVMVYIMTDYKQFRHMNASYKLMNENKVIFFKSYSTEVFYIDGTSLYPYFSFLEYTGSTTQKQITTFLRSNLLDGIRESNLIEKGYKAVLKWGRINYERGTRFSVTCYPLYMVVTNSYDTKMYRVSYDGKTLKEI